MNEILNGLFGTGELGFGDGGVHLGFARPISTWAWALLLAGIVGVSVWSYRHLVGAVRTRTVLAVVRGLLLMLLAILAMGPRLIEPHERIERDWTIVLVDRSASLSVPDAQDSGAQGSDTRRRSRDAQLRESIANAWPALREMDQSRNVLWMGFGAGAFDLSRTADATIDLDEPVQRRTALGESLDQALRRTSGRIVSAIVIASDGRSLDDISPEAIKRIQSERIRIVTIALGSETPMADLALSRVDAPDEAYVNDPVPVRVRVERLGTGDAPTARLQLVDDRTGIVLDEQELTGDAVQELTLSTKPDEPRQASWSVRIVTDSPDLVEANNTQTIELTLVDRPLRIAYFDGYPRWEYRYLKNLLLREASLRSSSLLLATNRRFTQEGDEALLSVPTSPEEWANFDVIIMGDLRPEVFSPTQLEQLRDLVATRGAGLIWIGGTGPTPGRWRGTPLEDLLPFTLNDSEGLSAYTEPVTIFAGDASERLGVLRMGDGGFSSRLSDPRTGWSRLWFAQRIEPASLKPTAEVLAFAAPEQSVRRAIERDGISALDHPPEDATPLVMTMRYGAGRVVYVGTDDTWRWRFGRGEALQEQFWIPLVRLPGRDSLARSGQPAVLDVSPSQALVDQPVRFTVRVLDQRLADAAGERVRLRARDARNPDDPGVIIELRASNTARTSGLTTFDGTWSFPTPADLTIEPTDAWLSGLGIRRSLTVFREDAEMRHPEADHAFLASIRERSVNPGLASETDPPVELGPESLADLPGLIPVRDLRTEAPPTVEPLWDRWIVLVMLLGLLTLEWVGRKLLSLA